jgi:hypothetical protein
MLFTAYLIVAYEQILVNLFLLDFGFRFAEILLPMSIGTWWRGQDYENRTRTLGNHVPTVAWHTKDGLDP